jgi:hypothetical protein
MSARLTDEELRATRGWASFASQGTNAASDAARTVLALLDALEAERAECQMKRAELAAALRLLGDGEVDAARHRDEINDLRGARAKLAAELRAQAEAWIADQGRHADEVRGLKAEIAKLEARSNPTWPGANWDPLGPVEQMPEDVQRDIATERGWARKP